MVSWCRYRKITWSPTARWRARPARSGRITALEYVQCVGDDVQAGKTTSFPQSVKLKPGEVVVFSWIVYKSRRDRDRINKAVMADPRLADMMDPKSLPFDGKRMFFGRFKSIVAL